MSRIVLSPTADPLLGVKVKINDSYFLIGLSRADADVARNIDEIATRRWFDFPLLLNDDRIAKLTFEKAADGERIVADALSAWKGGIFCSHPRGGRGSCENTDARPWPGIGT